MPWLCLLTVRLLRFCRTLRNNNSSRFGRFVKLDVAPTGGIHGGLINNYMLELSRIEFQGQGERNYHIFYQMIKGLSADEKAQCSLKSAEDYEFLNKSGCYEVETVDDLKEFADVRKQLEYVIRMCCVLSHGLYGTGRQRKTVVERDRAGKASRT